MVLYRLLMCADKILIACRIRGEKMKQTIDLAPREVVSNFLYPWVEYDARIKGRWVMKGVLGEECRPIHHVCRCEKGTQSGRDF